MVNSSTDMDRKKPEQEQLENILFGYQEQKWNLDEIKRKQRLLNIMRKQNNTQIQSP